MHEKELFLNDWEGAGCDRLRAEFELERSELDGVEVLLASYTRDAYCGEAFVLLKRDGRLFEVNASHDSSDGMEGQWDPEETLIAALRYRMEKGRLGRSEDGGSLFVGELSFLLAELEAEGFG